MKRKKDTGKPVKPVYDVPADWWYLQIEVPGAGSLDLEESPCDLGDEEGNNFLKKHGIRTVFAAAIRQDAYGELKPVMEGLCGRMGGFFCGDTADFTPVIKNP